MAVYLVHVPVVHGTFTICCGWLRFSRNEICIWSVGGICVCHMILKSIHVCVCSECVLNVCTRACVYACVCLRPTVIMVVFLSDDPKLVVNLNHPPHS